MAVKKPEETKELLKKVFEDAEAKANLVGLFDLLLRIDRRLNSEQKQ